MNTSRINIKPISVNIVWRGRRFKTPAYKEYEQELWYLLPNKNIPQGKLKITIKAGINTLADIDNIAKPFIDVLQKKYLFNDRNIYKLILEKDVVKKGKEYIEFKIEKYEGNN